MKLGRYTGNKINDFGRKVRENIYDFNIYS